MLPRPTASAALLAATTLALAVALPLDRLASRPSATASAVAASGDHAPVTVTLYHHALEWRTDPWLFVSANVTHVEGIRFDGRGGESGRDGGGHGRARGDGRVTLRLNSGSGRLFRPYDLVSIVTGSFAVARIGGPLTFTIPELRVDVAADRGSIEGVAEPGTAVMLVLDGPPEGDVSSASPGASLGVSSGASPGPSTTVVAGPTGRFRWNLGNGVRLAPGQGGWATMRDGDGNVFRARFAAFQLRIGLGRATGAGWLTPADHLEVRYPAYRTDLSLRTVGLNAGVDTADGRRRYGAASPSSSVPGTPCTVTVVSPILAPRSREVMLPVLTVDAATADRAAGTAPPGAALAVEVFAPDDGTDRDADRDVPPVGRLAAVADADGRWQVDLPPVTPHRPGGRVEAVLDLGDGLEVAAAALWPRFTVAVEGGRVSADAPSKGRYVLTVRAPDGEVIGRTGTLGTDADDRISIDLGLDGSWYKDDPRLPADSLTALLRGGTIEVDDETGGEPLVLAIPDLSATADADADTFAGTAPAGADLAIEVIGPFGARRFAATADDAGRWSLPLAGRIDVRGGIGARIWYANPSGHRFYVDTAVIGIVAEPGRSYLEAGPWTGRALRAEVNDAAGRLVGTVAVPADEGPGDGKHRMALTMTIGNWIVDRHGGEPPLEADDTIRARIGDDAAEWALPMLETRIDPERDVVAGRTLPGTRLEIIAGELDDPLSVTATVTADAAGDFRADLGGRADIAFRGGLYVRGYFGPHELRRFVAAPGMELDVEGAQVSGVLEPSVAIDVRLLDGDVVRAAGRTRSTTRGRFVADLRDAAGAPLVAQPGMRLVVESAEAKLLGRMALELPRFTLELGPTGRTVGGERPVDGYLSLGSSVAQDGWPIGGVRNPVPIAELPAERGRWQASLDGSVVPGDRIGASLYLANGHAIHRRLTQPILAVEHGGPRVCGFGQPHAAAQLALVAADGSTSAAAAAAAALDGTFEARWTDAAGRPVASRAGDRVLGRVGDGVIDIALDVLTATLDLPAGELRGQIRPGARPVLTSPSRDCLFRLAPDDERWLTARGLEPSSETYLANRALPSDGRITLALPPAPYAERGFDLHINAASRHRIFRTVYHALTLEAELTAGRIAGRTRPHADVRLSVTGPDGVVRAEIATAADASGAFGVAAAGGNGRPIALRPGDRITANATVAPLAGDIDGIGPETAAMTVADLAIDARADAIVGRAPAGARIGLSLDTGPLGRRWLAATAAADGRFAVGADDVPVRAGWTLADVRAVRAELAQDGGHVTAVRWSRPAHAVYLPWGGRAE